MNLVQVMGCVFYTYFMISRFAAPLFRRTGMEPGNLRYLYLYNIINVHVVNKIQYLDKVGRNIISIYSNMNEYL